MSLRYLRGRLTWSDSSKLLNRNRSLRFEFTKILLVVFLGVEARSRPAFFGSFKPVQCGEEVSILDFRHSVKM
jgi:hypothetical protein